MYQVDLTILRWVDLHPGQALEREWGEDIDFATQALAADAAACDRPLEQVKRRDNPRLPRGPAPP